jgi:hypothetical protein
MTLANLPFERNFQQQDSNASTGLENSPLFENLFKKVLNKPDTQSVQTIEYDKENAESSTSASAIPAFLAKQANLIFTEAKEEIFEDGMESYFSVNLSEFIKAYGHSAMEAIISIVLSNQSNMEVVSEALRVIGRLNHQLTYRERLWLLERCLYSDSAKIKDGAVLGLAFMDDPMAIHPLKSAIEREKLSDLRHDMEQVLAQLEGNEDGLPVTKDQKN